MVYMFRERSSSLFQTSKISARMEPTRPVDESHFMLILDESVTVRLTEACCTGTNRLNVELYDPGIRFMLPGNAPRSRDA